MLLPVKAERPDFRAVLTVPWHPQPLQPSRGQRLDGAGKKKTLIVKGLKSAPNETQKPGKHGHTPVRLDFLSRKQI